MNKIVFLSIFSLIMLSSSISFSEEIGDDSLSKTEVLKDVSSISDDKITDNIEPNYEDISVDEDTPIIENDEKQDRIEINATTESKDEHKPEIIIFHDIDEIKYNLPSCTDEKLIDEAYKFIVNILDENKNSGTLQRRKRYFILNNLDKFTEENILDYKTKEKSPVSEILADIMVNSKVSENNVRLCKNISKNKYASNIYMMIYPENGEYSVRIINLFVRDDAENNAHFTYKDQQLIESK